MRWAPWPNPKCGFGFRPMSNSSARPNSSASQLAEPSQIWTFCPARMDCPPSVTSRVAVRRFDGATHVEEQRQTLAQIQTAVIGVVRDLRAIDEFHHQIEPVVDFIGVVGGHDVGVNQPGRRPQGLPRAFEVRRVSYALRT